MREENVVTVTIFGQFTISCRGKKISERVAPVENQSWQLLKYLLVNAGRTISVDEVARELALTERATDAMNTLRVRLSRSRSLLDGIGLGSPKDGLLMYGDGQFWVNGDYRIVTDQEKIDRCYVSVSHQGMVRREDLDTYIETLASFGGGYLEHSRDSDWISKARAHYDKVYLQLLDRCMAAMAATGDYSRADVVLSSAQRLKPWALDVHERLLRELLAQNRIAEAATHYAMLAVQFANTELRLPEFRHFMN